MARVLLPELGAGAHVVGVDPEERSVEEADRRTRAFVAAQGLEVTVSHQVGKVEALPFPETSFDLVTLQTVLIHVASIPRAVDELHRVPAPGGTKAG